MGGEPSPVLTADGWAALAQMLGALTARARARAIRTAADEERRAEIRGRGDLAASAARLAERTGDDEAARLTGVAVEAVTAIRLRQEKEMNRARRLERDSMVVALRSAGVPIRTVAAAAKISPGRVSQIVSSYQP